MSILSLINRRSRLLIDVGRWYLRDLLAHHDECPKAPRGYSPTTQSEREIISDRQTGLAGRTLKT